MISHKKLVNGFEFVEVENNSASAKIALNGAHIFDYQRVGEESILWLSEIADFEEGKSIRGGIPVCWPWFGMNKDTNLPQHGFARTSKWTLTNTNEIDANTTELTLTLNHSKESLELWKHKFELSLHVEISDKLSLSLKTTNLDDKSFEITQALHSYFDISDILHVEIRGLENKPYLDALTMKQEVQNGAITFKQEVDRVYQEVDNIITLKDEKRTLHVENSGSSSCVVWNPWIDKCKRMSAMKDDDYKSMVCVESSNAFDDTIIIAPSE
ncbi:MAG: D-hexose-6-phosphate mutarotase [Epsilonproteobacteria bacterium]|nr:MAG: D-hexose-6-phosphate mutarotase [Campylobacterota bacterium]